MPTDQMCGYVQDASLAPDGLPAGRVGHDHAVAAYFYRELPYGERAAKQNPRLRAASGGLSSCTCQRYAMYQGAPGPCEHILAADAYRRGEHGSIDFADEEMGGAR